MEGVRGGWLWLLGCTCTLSACATSPAPTSPVDSESGVLLCPDDRDASATEVAGPTSELAHADFESHSPGPYTADMVYDDFGDYPGWNNGLDEGRATIVEEDGSHFLRVTYPAHKYGPKDAGVQFTVFFLGDRDELYLSYRLRFAAGFQFVQGGKLPGLVGGTAPTSCELDAVTISGGFSARMMWRTGGRAVQLVYTSKLVDSCGDDFPYQICGDAAHFAARERLREGALDDRSLGGGGPRRDPHGRTSRAGLTVDDIPLVRSTRATTGIGAPAGNGRRRPKPISWRSLQTVTSSGA